MADGYSAPSSPQGPRSSEDATTGGQAPASLRKRLWIGDKLKASRVGSAMDTTQPQPPSTDDTRAPAPPRARPQTARPDSTRDRDVRVAIPPRQGSFRSVRPVSAHTGAHTARTTRFGDMSNRPDSARTSGSGGSTFRCQQHRSVSTVSGFSTPRITPRMAPNFTRTITDRWSRPRTCQSGFRVHHKTSYGPT